MPNAFKAVQWLGDIIQVLFLDRFHPRYKTHSQMASTACRSLKFHSRSRIRQKPLAELLATFPSSPVTDVRLPGPSIELGHVGSHTYYHTLGGLVRAVQPKTVLEFGTYLGVSAHTMALNLPPTSRIYTVDLPDDALAQPAHALNDLDQSHIAWSRQRVGQAFLGTPQQSQIVQIRADSMTFRAESALAQADLVFVDGGHSLPLITKDTQNAFRVLAPGGLVLWDDYFHLYPDVVRYLDDLSRRCVLHGIAGTNFVLYSDTWQARRPSLE